jgi:rare lipoprotein A
MTRAAVLLLIAICGACAPAPRSRSTAEPPDAPLVLRVREGLASFYAQSLDGRLTASGVKIDLDSLVAAHPTYPFGTRVRVTNLENDRTVDVTVIDRGPAAGPQAEGVLIDLSRAAARALGMIEDGRVRVQLQVVRWGQQPLERAAAD